MSNTTEQFILRKAALSEVPQIWNILQDAIEQRRQDGSTQWQDGYPNELTIQNDIKNGYAYVLTENESILCYAAIIFDKEPAYEEIQGKWLTNGDYAVVHRVAASKLAKGKGIATTLFKNIEDVCLTNNIYSIKIVKVENDTIKGIKKAYEKENSQIKEHEYERRGVYPNHTFDLVDDTKKIEHDLDETIEALYEDDLAVGLSLRKRK